MFCKVLLCANFNDVIKHNRFALYIMKPKSFFQDRSKEACLTFAAEP